MFLCLLFEQQMAGRAGRSGMASEGKVYLFDESGNIAKAKATATRLWGSNTELDIPSVFHSGSDLLIHSIARRF
jgi:hypothetical protein